MIVTDKKYMIEDQLLSKLDLMIKRLKGTDDVVLIIDGDEGQGKTELTIGVCYYIAYKTKRSYTPANVFFDLDEIISYASSTKEKIIHFDEGALGLMRTQWQKSDQQKFLQLVMVARKKKHFIAVCIPKFHRLNPYIIQDRSIGLLHVYSHRNIHKGRYCYFTKNAKLKLFEDYQKKRVISYQKHFSFRGRFVQASEKVFNKEQNKEYDDKKDKAILSVGDVKKNISERYKTWIDQRNKLVRYIKEKENLSMRHLATKLNEAGIELKKSNLHEICSPSNTISPQL